MAHSFHTDPMRYYVVLAWRATTLWSGEMTAADLLVACRPGAFLAVGQPGHTVYVRPADCYCEAVSA